MPSRSGRHSCEVIMNEKEIGEIRRRMRRDRSNMTTIYGCYVNTQKEIVSEFQQSIGMMPENESEKYFALLKKVLSGGIGRNLIDITFRTSQVAGSEEHKLLMTLRDTQLKDENARLSIYKKIMENLNLSENYLILLGCESYDVPFKGKDDEIHADRSEEVYTYFTCAVCPVKLTKSALRYRAEDKVFHDGGAEMVACAPELGFVFPAFDNRAANIYNALFYTRSPKENYESIVDVVFGTKAPKPAYEQKKSFESLLYHTLEDNCSLEVVQTVHEQICQCIDMHKESKITDPLLISKEQVKDALTTCGVPETNIAKFSVQYDETFGADAQLHPKNIIDSKRFEIVTPDVSIKVSPDRSDLIQTRIIGGIKYLLICADENVEVNGVPICIEEMKAEV